MKVTSQLLAPGFWRRSIGEAKRLTNIAVTLEAIHMPCHPFDLVNFNDPAALENCKIMSDKDQDGFSTNNLDFVSATPNSPAHAHFHGNISTKLPPNRPDIVRSGYAAWRTRDLGATIFGRSYWDVDPYTYLALRIKSDGRKYFVNLMTETIVPTDIHQHRLHSSRPGEWETVLIRWADFVRTSYGQPVEPQGEMLRQKLKSVGIGLTDGVPGPFSLRVEKMWSTNENETGREVSAKGAMGADVGTAEEVKQRRKVEIDSGGLGWEGKLKRNEGFLDDSGMEERKRP